MNSKLLVALAAIGGFVGYCFHCGRGVKATTGAIKEDLNRWEGEGGNMPAVATPSPAPRASYPLNEPAVRH